MIKKDKAFTLVELLVVVAVLALLASIVFSNLTGAREQAKISNILAFQSQVHNLMGSDLIGWWNFDEGTGSVAKDSSGYGNDGTIVGATRVDGIPGAGGKALEFNGSNNRVDFASGTTQEILNGTPAITLTAWVNQHELAESQKVIIGIPIHNSLNAFGLELIDFGYISLGGRSQSGDSFQSIRSDDALIIEDKWCLIIGIIDYANKKIEIFLNDELVKKSNGITFGSTFFNKGNNGYTRIGMTPSITAERYFNGLIDDVRIYSRALTAHEVQTLYAQTKDKYLAKD